MRKILLLLTFLFWFRPTLATVECLPRRNDDSVNLSVAMYHWGRATRLVGALALKGIAQPSANLATQTEEAIQSLQIALACAELVIQDTRGHFYPRKSFQLEDDNRLQYLERHFALARLFRTEMARITEIFCELRLAPSAELYQRLQAGERELLRLANQAHTEL